MTPDSAKINNGTKIKTTHYDNGKVQSKTPYVNGKKHGLETEWWESGQKHWERMLRKNKKHGVNTVWRENGTRMWEVTYAYGKNMGSWFGGIRMVRRKWKCIIIIKKNTHACIGMKKGM